MDWKHDDLANDLAQHLKGASGESMVWCDMQLGPSGSARPDVYVLKKSYSRFQPRAYEVKISRADFLSDINSGKWQKYRRFASAVSFAVPDGLVKKTEVPDGVGLIVRKEKVWRQARAPRIEVLETLPREAWMKLLINGLDRLRPPTAELHRTHVRDAAFRRALGDEIAGLVREREFAAARIAAEIEAHKRRLAGIREQHCRVEQQLSEKNGAAAGLWADLCDFLGLTPGASQHVAYAKINEIKRALDRDEQVESLNSVISRSVRELERARSQCLEKLKKPEAA